MSSVPFVRKRPRARNRDGKWRKKRSDAGMKRGERYAQMARGEDREGIREERQTRESSEADCLCDSEQERSVET